MIDSQYGQNCNITSKLEEIKLFCYLSLNDNQYREFNCNIVSDTGQDKNECNSVSRIEISVLRHWKTKINDNQYGELLFKF